MIPIRPEQVKTGMLINCPNVYAHDNRHSTLLILSVDKTEETFAYFAIKEKQLRRGEIETFFGELDSWELR